MFFEQRRWLEVQWQLPLSAFTLAAESNISSSSETSRGGVTQRNIWKKEDISAFESKCKKQQVHNGHFGWYEMRHR